MFAAGEKQLHWSQRMALVRHNFHFARRSGDYTFFKSLQTYAFIQGTDYVASLTAALGNEADVVLNTLDGLNSGIAYIYQDAFKQVHDSLKTLMMSNYDKDSDSVKARLCVDVVQQVQRADFALDRIINSAIALIQLQPVEHQSNVACAWILGATIISDAVNVSMCEMNNIHACVGDYIRLESSWSDVKACTDAATTALRGILNLMATDDSIENHRRMSTRRSSSTSGTSTMGMLRRLSSAFSTQFAVTQPPPPYKRSSVSSSASQPGVGCLQCSQSSPPSPSTAHCSSGQSVSMKLQRTPTSSVNPPGSFPRDLSNETQVPTGLSPIPATPGLINDELKFYVNPSSYSTADVEPMDKSDMYVRPKIEIIDPLHIAA